MWSNILWLCTVATALSYNDPEVILLQESVGEPLGPGRIALNPGSEGAVKAAVHYTKVPGLSYNEEAESVEVQSHEGCRQACNARATGCASYSFNEASMGCVLSTTAMLFDPDSSLSILRKSGGFYKISGLSYFHDHHGEWLHTTVNTPEACQQVCEQAKNCKAFKFGKKHAQCALTGKEIVFGPDWNYYSKVQQLRHSKADSVSATHIAEIEAEHLAKEIEEEKAQLKEAREAVARARQDARDELKRQADDNGAIAIMQQRLEQAKVAAKQEVREVAQEQELKRDAAQLKLKSAEENLKVQQQFASENAHDQGDNVMKRAHKEITELNEHAEEVEREKETASRIQVLKEDVLMAEQNATHIKDLAKRKDAELQEARSSLQASEESDANTLAAEEHYSQEALDIDKKMAHEKKDEVLTQQTSNVQSAVELQKINLSAEEERAQAQAQAIAANKRANAHFVQLRLRYKAAKLTREIDHWQKHLAAEERRSADLHARLRGLLAPIKSAPSNSSNSSTPAMVEPLKLPTANPKLLAKYKKEQAEAAKETARAEAESKQIQAKAKEHAAKLHQRMADQQVQQAKFVYNQITRQRKEYVEALAEAKRLAKEGREHVQQVADEAAQIEDQKKADAMLEQAKKEYRAKIRDALTHTQELRAKITNEPVVVMATAKHAVSVSNTNTSVISNNTLQALDRFLR